MSLKKKEKINVFIDTNVIFRDWFFQSMDMKISKYLIQEGIINLHISSIVMEEFRKNYKNTITDIENKIENSFLELKKNILNEENIYGYNFNKEAILKTFEENITYHLVNDFTLVKYPKNRDLEDMMETVISNAVNEIPPFKKKDDGFRDSIIFESYLYKIKNYGLENNYFVTKDKTFYTDEVTKRIGQLGVQLEIIDDLQKVFDSKKVFPYLEKNKNIITQEKIIESKVRDYIKKYSDLIAKRFFQSFSEGLQKSFFSNSQVQSLSNLVINNVRFTYNLGEALWVSIEHEVKLKMVEFGTSYDVDTNKQFKYKIRDFFVNVGGTSNIEIDTTEIKDFNLLEDNMINLNSVDAELILNEYPYKEVKFEDMPI